MRFAETLRPARLIRRYKRFLADVVLDDGREATVHCPNPGSMLGLAEPGCAVWLSESRNPARKHAFTWELADAGGALVGVNTGWANTVAAEALQAGGLAELAGYASQRREVPYGHKSRIDFLLEAEGRPPCYLEVKSVTLSRRPGIAEFPDAVTARGAKHLGELAQVAEGGGRAVQLFLVQRADCARVRLAGDIDPAYAVAFSAARARGVEILCYSCQVGPEAIDVDRRLPFEEDGGGHLPSR